MKSLIAFFLFGITITISYSKDSVKNYPFLNSEQKGIIQLQGGERFEATISFDRLPAYVTFTKSGEDKSETLYANNFKWIKIDSLIFVPIKYRPDESTAKNYSIVQVLDTGRIELYRYFSFAEASSNTAISQRNSFFTTEILKKEKQKYTHASSTAFIFFRKAIVSYIEDYPELNNKVQNKEKGYKKREDLEHIIKEYNDFYDIQNQEIRKKELANQKLKEEQEREKLKEELREEILKELEEEKEDN